MGEQPGPEAGSGSRPAGDPAGEAGGGVVGPGAEAAELAWGPLLRAHPLAHFVYDPQTLQLLAANAAALARYGYTEAEFLRLSRADLLLPGELGPLREFIQGLPDSALRDPQRVWLERTRDGRVLHADVRGMPVRFEGRCARLAAVVDAGLRERLAADAGQVRDLLAVAGRIAQLGGWRLELPGWRLHLSDEACALHEVAAGTVFELDAALAFYPGSVGASVRDALHDGAAQGVAFDLELPFVGARGSRRWVRLVGAPRPDEAGRVAALEGAIQDITERKQAVLALEASRRHMKALLQAIPDLWLVIDAQGRYAEVSNPQHPSLARPWAEMAGRRLDEVLPPAVAQMAADLISQAQRTGRLQTRQYLLDTQAGPARALEARGKPLGEGRTWLLIRDLSDARERDDAQRARAVAEESERLQSAFMSRASHELRTPLNAILGFGQLLQGAGQADARVAGYARHIVQAGGQMLALVEDLLEMQRAEAAAASTPAPVALAPLLADCAELLRPLAETTGCTLAQACEPGLTALGDERSLRQILLNLGSNAIRHGRAAAGASRVSLQARAAGEALLLQVSDNGPGLPAPVLQRLFEPFERRQVQAGAGAAVTAGLGLGLFVARRLARQLGGEVELHSQAGSGTTATLRLPRQPAPA
ncbi:MAG: PAS domain-containing sensor histidine kinase [Burkholderiales bacterium]|nr:PAS domain-containing sensor histidine kinase [Burkholderiales bacterium]